MASIQVSRASKHFGSVRAVDDVSFTVPAGSFVVLLGPSGCGKSTTLRLIAGLETVTSGRIWIGDIDVTDLPPSRRRIAMVFQSYALFPHLNVRENIVFGLKVRRVPAPDRAARLARVAELLGLAGLLHRKPGQLSGGQQQRVALGRAIIAETPVCLMDEPLSNLDAQLRQTMRRELRALQRHLGITTVYVTHDQVEALSMADRVVVLRDGRVEQDAPPAELYARPASVFVARFIGTPPMNVLRLADVPGGAAVRGTAVPVLGRPAGEGFLLGLRPEDVRLTSAGLPARVLDSEYLGADTVVNCAVGEETLKLRLPGRAPVTAGAEVRLGWTPDALHLFDATSGRRRDDVLQEPGVRQAKGEIT
ncbi:MAG TPA: ABC transporter ATP-binding protein [Candidatus Binatia bacterium]|nr:ABC transporter ATP-binding protein [Candidatus Binatia bacterium]